MGLLPNLLPKNKQKSRLGGHDPRRKGKEKGGFQAKIA